MFNIGPDIKTSIFYDLIVYEDAVQFHLKKCETCDFVREVKGDKDRIVADVMRCLMILHSLHIVHKDAKPSNVLGCLRLGRYVICDFGCQLKIRWSHRGRLGWNLKIYVRKKQPSLV